VVEDIITARFAIFFLNRYVKNYSAFICGLMTLCYKVLGFFLVDVLYDYNLLLIQG